MRSTAVCVLLLLASLSLAGEDPPDPFREALHEADRAAKEQAKAIWQRYRVKARVVAVLSRAFEEGLGSRDACCRATYCFVPPTRDTMRKVRNDRDLGPVEFDREHDHRVKLEVRDLKPGKWLVDSVEIDARIDVEGKYEDSISVQVGPYRIFHLVRRSGGPLSVHTLSSGWSPSEAEVHHVFQGPIAIRPGDEKNVFATVRCGGISDVVLKGWLVSRYAIERPGDYSYEDRRRLAGTLEDLDRSGAEVFAGPKALAKLRRGALPRLLAEALAFREEGPARDRLDSLLELLP